MTEHQIVREALKTEINKLTKEEQDKVHEIAGKIAELVNSSIPAGFLALALIGATAAAEADHEGE